MNARSGGNGGSGGPSSVEELLHNSVFPAMKKMDKGMKKREIEMIPVRKFKPNMHNDTLCSICQ
jgi:hypothetical protein